MSSFTKRPSGAFLLIAAFCLAGSLLGYFASQADRTNHQVLITLESSVPIETQLYYDSGRGFNEGDSIKQAVYQANLPVTLSFEIPGPKLKNLRFDPGRSHARVKILEILIQYHTKGSPFAVPLDSMTAARDIRSLQFDGKALTVETTEAAQDPILLPGRIGQAPEPSTIRVVLFILGGALAAFGMAFFVLWVYRNSLDSKEFDT